MAQKTFNKPNNNSELTDIQAHNTQHNSNSLFWTVYPFHTATIGNNQQRSSYLQSVQK